MTEHIYRIDLAPAETAAPEGGWWGTAVMLRSGEKLLDARDLGASRGDGIFETFGTRGERVHASDAHLARLAASARTLDLPEPNREQLREVVYGAVRALGTDGQGSIKLVMTRGVEGTGRATGWMVASVVEHDTFAGQRDDGIDVVTLDRGYSSDVSERAPWLLTGAKTLSYAVNMAALREARRRGADDALFVSSDGFVLEAPTSNLVARLGDRFVTTPPANGILAGTTQADLFSVVEGWGGDTEYRLLTIDEVLRADAAWLVSSVRLAAPIRRLDGAELSVDAPLTTRINEALLAR